MNTVHVADSIPDAEQIAVSILSYRDAWKLAQKKKL